eukprot:SAG11_NODE_3286_length_2552_cov_2.992662_1_plen_315_part_00
MAKVSPKKGEEPTKGLRQISISLIKLIKERQRITQNEVADEMSQELESTGTAGQNTEGGAPPPTRSPSYTESPSSEKNIRRRVYDALNVLRSAGVIAYEQDKKTITWRGLPEQFELKTLEAERQTIAKRLAEKKALAEDLAEKQRGFAKLLARNRAIDSEGGAKVKRQCLHMPFITIRTDPEARWQRWERDEELPYTHRGRAADGSEAELSTAPYVVYDFSKEFQLHVRLTMSSCLVACASGDVASIWPILILIFVLRRLGPQDDSSMMHDMIQEGVLDISRPCEPEASAEAVSDQAEASSLLSGSAAAPVGAK